MNVGRARGVVEIPAVGGLRAYVDADVDDTPRMVIQVNHLQVRFVLPHALLTVEAVGAVDRLAATSMQWKQAVGQLATDHGVIPR